MPAASAAPVIIAAVLTPILTSFVYKRAQRQRALEGPATPATLSAAAAPGD